MLAALAVALQIAWPLAGPIRPAVTVAVVIVFAAASVAAAVAGHGRRMAGAMLALTAGFGFAVEVVGVHTGLPFGHYGYARTLGVEVAGVPLVVALAWTMFAWPAALVGRRLGRSRAERVAVTAWSLAAWDLFLDPQMVRAGHWRWADPSPHLPGVPTVPLTNLVGWILASTVLSAVVQAVLDRSPAGPVDDRVPVALYLWTYFASALALAAFLDLAAAAAWGALGMGVVVVPLLRSLRVPTVRGAPPRPLAEVR